MTDELSNIKNSLDKARQNIIRSILPEYDLPQIHIAAVVNGDKVAKLWDIGFEDTNLNFEETWNAQYKKAIAWQYAAWYDQWYDQKDIMATFKLLKDLDLIDLIRSQSKLKLKLQQIDLIIKVLNETN